MMQRIESRGKRITILVMAVGILIPGAYGFIEKLIQFVRTLNTDSGAGFTIIPISNYFLIAAGMACMLAWAIANGMFHDIEKPKYTMLDQEAELEDLIDSANKQGDNLDG
jgi:hypothetical protein